MDEASKNLKNEDGAHKYSEKAELGGLPANHDLIF